MAPSGQRPNRKIQRRLSLKDRHVTEMAVPKVAHRIDELKIGDPVHVTRKNENGPVIEIQPPTITVRLLTSEVEVREGGFERR